MKFSRTWNYNVVVGIELGFQIFFRLINRPRVNLSYILYIGSKLRSKDSLKHIKTAEILYIFEKLFQKLVEWADGPSVHYSSALYF